MTQRKRARLISALLIGPISETIYAPIGRDVGGTFQNISFCTRRGQAGCIVSYNTFPREAPPGETGFGRAPPDNEQPCTEPALLAGNPGRYRGTYFPYRYAVLEALGGGTHTGDFSFMQDDLIDLVAQQARAAD